MPRFVNTLKIKHRSKGRWVTLESLVFAYEDRREIVVPAGFETDLDSVPRIPVLHAWLKGRATEAAVVHDYLYNQCVDRKFADKTMLEAMVAQGVPWWRRYPIYWGVRAGGWVYYLKHCGRE